MSDLSGFIKDELSKADLLIKEEDLDAAFHHLERAHVLGQSRTFDHTRIHWRMFKLAFKMNSIREIWGQFIRIIGASTKTPLGLYPKGNTGGANVWFFKPMPIEDDLQQIIARTK